MPALIDARPAGIDLLFRPGVTLTLVSEWPAGALVGRSFSSTLNGTPLAVNVNADELTVVVTDVQTAVTDAASEWLLLEDVDGTDEPIMVGTWAPSDSAAAVSQQTVQVTQGAATVNVTVSASGPATTPIDSLPAAALPLQGDEVLPGLQDGVGVKFTTADLAGGPVETINGVSRDRVRWFEEFDSFVVTVTTDVTVLVGTKCLTLLSGTGAQVAQDAGLSILGSAGLSTGTTAAGRCALNSAAAVLHLFDPASTFALGARVKVPVVSDGSQTYQIRSGIMSTLAGTPTDGFYFRSPAGAGNWDAVVRAASVDTVVSTGTAYDANGAYHTLVVTYDPTFKARFWIDGTLVATITTGLPANGANLTNRGVGIFKSVGTTARVVSVDAMSWNLPDSAPGRTANMP